MGPARRNILLTFLGALMGRGQDQLPTQTHQRRDTDKEEDTDRLPDGKSRKDAIARQDFAQSLKDAETLIADAQSLRDELQKSGSFVVSVASVKRTEEIERLARKIRSRLKA